MAIEAWLRWVPTVVDLWNEWGIRLAAVSSLALHILVLLLAETRRCNGAYPGWALLLWLFYLLLDKVGDYALGHLSLDDTGDEAAAKKEQLVVAFWAPFLLLYLGGPNNIGAYSLDDDKLDWRKSFDAFLKVLGALYVVLTKIWLADDGGVLVQASQVMLAVGVFRLLENAAAIMGALKRKSSTAMLHDSSSGSPSEWGDDLCDKAEKKAAEIYEMLYTKAGQVHTWRGYLLRLFSPLATATAGVLFGLYPQECLQAVDVRITYALLGAALVLDVLWLWMALASTSALKLKFLKARSKCRLTRWLRHQMLCRGWWCRLRRLHPARLILGKDPSTYGTWSEVMGRCDLLAECTRSPPGCLLECLGRFFKKDASVWSEHYAWKRSLKLPKEVKDELFKRITDRLKPPPPNNNADDYMKDIRSEWGQAAVRKKNHRDLLGFFGSAFQEDILLWHIATAIYLKRSHALQPAIEAASEYLMFLLAARPHMLPDPPLRRLYEVTHQALQDLYNNNQNKPQASLCCASRKKKLADTILRSEELQELNRHPNTRLVSVAARLAKKLKKLEDASTKPDAVAELVLDVWVDKLLYAGINCSRDSHARQLGRGGELVTIACIAAEYVGVFPIGYLPKRPDEPDPDPRPDEPDPDPRPDEPDPDPHNFGYLTCQCYQPCPCKGGPHTCHMNDHYCCKLHGPNYC